MRVLLLHPDDDPERGPWLRSQWDRVFDLALASPADYARWTDLFGCPVVPAHRSGSEEFRRIRQILSFGLGRLIDDHGFDWWDLLLLRFFEDLERGLALQKVLATCLPDDELVISRAGLQVDLLKMQGRQRLSCFPRNSSLGRILHVAAIPRRLRFRDLLQIAGDKFDAGYRLRRLIAPRETPSSVPLVLLPSAYGNASKAALQYARALPDIQFLLVTTRSSATPAAVPENVRVAQLASYAPGVCSQSELQRLLEPWCRLHSDLHRHQELLALARLGLFNNVPGLLREGLCIRDAWLRVLDCEPVFSVLSADEGNPYTRLPLLIAKKQAMPAIACHHGALDFRYLFRSCVAETFLAKGRMESDYLTSVCGLSREKLKIASATTMASVQVHQKKTTILFFSEPYEHAAIRARELYAEVLPRLAKLAADNGCQLILKLHPFESRREREKLARTVLAPEHNSLLRVVDGPLTEHLLARAWFGVTVSSTTVVDCALRSVPAFVCTWLDPSDCSYSRQFLKFRAAAPLADPEQISRIPDLLGTYQPANLEDLAYCSSSDELRNVLLPTSEAANTTSAGFDPLPEALWA